MKILLPKAERRADARRSVKNIPSNRTAPRRLRFIVRAAQILARVSNNHRLAGRGQHRHRQTPAHGGNFFDARRNPQADALSHCHPQIHHRRLRRRTGAFRDLKFSGHEQLIATRVPEIFFSPPSQLREQFAVDAVETAVAEHADHVAALRVFRQMRDDGVRVRQIRRGFAGGFQILH